MKHLRYLGTIALMLAITVGCSQKSDDLHLMNSMAAVGVGSINGIPGQYCTDLFAGQTIEAGNVCIEIIDNGDTEEMCVTYTTTDGWVLIETQAWAGEDLADMPQNRKGNPKVGNFPYHSGDITGQTSYSFCIDLNQYGTEGGVVDLCGMMLYAATHAVVGRDADGDGVYEDQETAWGDGDRMVDRGNWSTYFTISLACELGGGSESGETAFAYDCGDDALCFIDIPNEGINRWGWTNGAYGPGTYYLDIYAGAGQCDVSKGTLVGLLTVDYDGSTAIVTYNTCGGYMMDEVHLYVGNDILAWDDNPGDPGYTVAPGKFPYTDDDIATNSYTFTIDGLSGDIYVVAHAVVVGDYSAGDCGVRGCVAPAPPCVPGFDYDEFQAQIDAENNDPGQLKIKVTYPTAGGAAYFPTTVIDVNGDGIADITTQSWCIDLDHTITQNWYCADLYSSFNYPVDLDDTRWENLDMVNWILNQGYVGTVSPGGYGTYTYGDIQRAIWSLVEPGGQQSTSGLGSWNGNRVAEILAAASSAVPIDDVNVDYEPPCDGVAGVIIKPVGCTAGEAQILIAQILVAEYPSVCSVCP
jgi:hypothetical protein